MAPKNIPLHPLGRNGPMVPALGQGMMGASAAYGEALKDDEMFALLDKAHEIGSRFWDTADVYGTSEEAIGKWFKKTGKRGDIFLATKFGYQIDAAGIHRNSTPEYAKQACSKSLEKLGIDYIDLYYMHVADETTPIEETMRALIELKAEGKIKNIGLSMISAKALRRAVKIAPVAAIQVDYSLFYREIEATSGTAEANILSTARELGVAIVCATPLGRGLLSSTFKDYKAISDGKDFRAAVPSFQSENAKHNTAMVQKVHEFAEKKGCSVAQLGLAWLLKQGDDIFPIPGTKRLVNMVQNFEALDVALSDEEELEIRRYAESVQVAGGNVPDSALSWVYVDTAEPKV